MIKFVEDVRGKPYTKAQDEMTFTSGKMTELMWHIRTRGLRMYCVRTISYIHSDYEGFVYFVTTVGCCLLYMYTAFDQLKQRLLDGQIGNPQPLFALKAFLLGVASKCAATCLILYCQGCIFHTCRQRCAKKGPKNVETFEAS